MTPQVSSDGEYYTIQGLTALPRSDQVSTNPELIAALGHRSHSQQMRVHTYRSRSNRSVGHSSFVWSQCRRQPRSQQVGHTAFRTIFGFAPWCRHLSSDRLRRRIPPGGIYFNHSMVASRFDESPQLCLCVQGLTPASHQCTTDFSVFWEPRKCAVACRILLIVVVKDTHLVNNQWLIDLK